MADSTDAAIMSDYMSGVSVALINAASSDKERAEAQKWAEEQANLAYQRSLNDRDYANDYNSPLQKRKRLEAAGISPWTEFGGMNNNSETTKVPMPPTLPAAPGLQLQPTQLFSQMMAMKQQTLQAKGLEASLIAQGIDNENKIMQNEAMKFFLTREMQRDSDFKAAQQQEAIKEWNRLSENHQEKLREYERAKETYAHVKNMRQYDEPAKKAAIAAEQKRIEKMNQELMMMDLEGGLLRQKFSIGVEEILKMKQEYNKIQNEEQYNNYIRNRNAYYMDQYDIDPKNSGTVETLTKKLLEAVDKGDRNIRGKFGIPKATLRPTWNPIDY